ncbi:DUF4164 domain-containing protein [Beijerinckia mobilis]|uniref:DUF4164 domain-containing protein n=1 Tax=Beijerinckia mobilis TaxID=231434 RepID=UPI0009FEB2F9|nr:DUF4164 domain-containing protein [Beijerinckia mobilis]
MPISDELAGSLKRIEAMLDRLEAASERRLRQDQMRSDAAAELRLLQEDRSRLALELDAALARNEALAEAQAEVSARLQSVGDSLQLILTRTESGMEPEADGPFVAGDGERPQSDGEDETHRRHDDDIPAPAADPAATRGQHHD